MTTSIAPDVAAALRAMKPDGAPPLNTLEPAAVRAGFAAMAAAAQGPKRPVGAVDDRTIDGPGGALPLRIYRPAHGAGHAGTPPLIVYFHGGGFVLCGLDTHDDGCRDLCAEVGAVVVSVDYRLAPEHKFPAAADDCFAALRWAADHAAELGADADRIALAGDSAGGTLAIVCALRGAAAGTAKLCALLPLYPATDLRLPNRHASARRLGSGEFGLSERDMRWFTRHYLRSDADAEHPEASPLLAEHLGALPPTLFVVAVADPLRDEGLAMAARLHAAGVPTEVFDAPALPHGFFHMGQAPTARRAIDHITRRLRAMLADTEMPRMSPG